MIKCQTCKDHYPHDSDYATCIKEFSECVDCRISKGEFYEYDLVWIKFIQNKDVAAVH